MTKSRNETTEKLIANLLSAHEEELTLRERLFLVGLRGKPPTARQAKRVAQIHLKYNPPHTRAKRNAQSSRRLRVDGEVT
jgi:hypothetical protein